MAKILKVLKELAGRRVAEDARWVVLGQMVAFAGRLVGLRVLTDLVSPDTYAEIVLLIGLTTLGGNTFCSPLTEAAIRFFPESHRDGRGSELRSLLRSMLVPRIIIAALILIVGGLAWDAIGSGHTSALAITAAVLLLILDVSKTFENGLMNAARLQRTFAWWQMMDAWSRAAGAAIFLKLWGESAFYALTGYIAAAGCTNAIFHRWRIGAENRERPTRDQAWRAEIRERVLRFSRPLAPVAFLGWMISLSDRYMIAAMVGEAEAGIYAAAYGLASQPFIMASNVLNLTMRPIFNEAVARADVRDEKKIFLTWLGLSLIVLLAGLFLINILAEPLVGVALGKDFQSASRLLPVISIAYVLQGIQQVFSILLYSQQRTGALMTILFISCAVAVLMFWTLIPRLGGMGAGIGACASMLVSLIATIFASGIVSRLAHGRSLGTCS